MDYDAHGESCKGWSEAALESEQEYPSAPMDGPLCAVLMWQTHMSPRRRPATVVDQVPNDRPTHEMKVIIKALYVAGTLDRLTAGRCEPPQYFRLNRPAECQHLVEKLTEDSAFKGHVSILGSCN